MNRTCAWWMAATAGLVACGGGSSMEQENLEPVEGQQITVEVTNQNFNDANVYAIYAGGRRHRLGTVGGNGRQTFAFRYFPGELYFRIDYIGGRSVRTEADVVRPGDALELRLSPNETRFYRRG